MFPLPLFRAGPSMAATGAAAEQIFLHFHLSRNGRTKIYIYLHTDDGNGSRFLALHYFFRRFRGCSVDDGTHAYPEEGLRFRSRE